MLALTWHDVPESDGGDGDETEVEGVHEGPVLEVGEHVRADREEGPQEAQGNERHDYVGRYAFCFEETDGVKGIRIV